MTNLKNTQKKAITAHIISNPPEDIQSLPNIRVFSERETEKQYSIVKPKKEKSRTKEIKHNLFLKKEF